MRVDDLYRQNERPLVTPSTPLRDTILEMTSRRLGCAVVVDDNRVVGIVCDGDLRRMMKKHHQLDGLTAGDIMSLAPKTVKPAEYAVKALDMMRHNAITQLVVVDEQGDYLGVLHIHDILREGII